MLRDDDEPEPLNETEPDRTVAPFAPFSSVGPAAIRAQGVQGGGGQAARGGRGQAARGRGRGRGRGRAKSTTTPQPRCTHCNGLIQHKRRDPKHVECRICDGFFHNKCVKRTFGAGTFTCYRCNPDGEQPQPAAVPASRLPRGPLQDPAPPLAPAQPDDALHGDVDLVVCGPLGDTLASVTTDSTPVTVPVPASGLIYDADIDLEQLLIEAEGPTKPAELDLPDPAPAPGPARPDDVLHGEVCGVPPTKPSYLDNMPQMDLKLNACGFKRSPSQLNTPAAGNCGPEGELLFYLDLGVWIRA